MDDGRADINPDLTSTVCDVLLSSENDKTDANDSTPTSSTDAALSFAETSLIVSEDPISSTSSDVMEKNKHISEINNEKETEVSKNLLGTDGDVDLLDMNIANVSDELISEDVEDIVQDLENLLGEPEPQHDFKTRRKEKSPQEEKELLASLDDPLSENIEFNMNPPSFDNTELVEKIESKDDQIFITETPHDIEKENLMQADDTLLTENVPLIETIESAEEVEINITENISCQSNESEEVTSQVENVTQTEIVEDEIVDSETIPVTSSENADSPKVHPKCSSEENSFNNDIQETEKAIQLDKNWKSTHAESSDINIFEDPDAKITNVAKDDVSVDKSCNASDTKTQVTNEEDNAERKGQDIMLPSDIIQAETDGIPDLTEGNRSTISQEEVISDIQNNPTEAEIVAVVDGSISDMNSSFKPSSENVIDRSFDIISENSKTSVVATDVSVASSKTDAEFDVNVSSSSDSFDKESCTDREKTDDCVIPETPEENINSNLNVCALFTENLALTDTSMLGVVETGNKFGIPKMETESLSSSDELAMKEEKIKVLLEENTESSTKKSIQTLEAGSSEIENILITNNEDKMETNLTVFFPKILSEEKTMDQKEENEMITDQYKMESIKDDKNGDEGMSKSPEKSETEKKINSVVEPPMVDFIFSTNEETEPSKGEISNESSEKLITEEKSAEQNLHSNLDDQNRDQKEQIQQTATVEVLKKENSELKTISQAIEEESVSTTEYISDVHEPPSVVLKGDENMACMDQEESIVDESISTSKIVSVINESSDEDRVSSMTQKETTLEELVTSETILSKNEPLEEDLKEDINAISLEMILPTKESLIENLGDNDISIAPEQNENLMDVPREDSKEKKSSSSIQELDEPSEITSVVNIQEDAIGEKENCVITVVAKTTEKQCSGSTENIPDENNISLEEDGIAKESSISITEKEDEIKTNIDKKSDIEIREYTEELVEEEEKVIEEKTLSKPGPIEILQESNITESTKSVQENSVEIPPSDVEPIIENIEKPENCEIVLDELSPNIPNQDVIECSTESSQNESKQKITNTQTSTEEKMIPVNEELCVKKSIIYKHDCDSHHHNQDKTNKEKDESISLKHNVDITEKKSEQDSVLKPEILPSGMQILENQQASACVVEKIEAEIEKVESIVVEADEHQDLMNEPKNSVEEFPISDQKVPDTHLQQVFTDIHSEISNQPNSAILINPIIEISDEQIMEQPCNDVMEDQTSAAVQSILDNMSAETSNIEKILEKEEPPVVHSSYSSYEIQKAVQEIQCITQTEDVAMSQEGIQCISNSEKLCDTEKQSEIAKDNSEIAQIDDRNDAHISENKELDNLSLSKPEYVSTSKNVELVAPEKLVVHKEGEDIQAINEIRTSNEDSIIQFDITNESVDEEIKELTSPLPTKEFTSDVTQEDSLVVIPSIDLSEESSSEEGSDEEKKHNVVSSSSTLDEQETKTVSPKNPSKIESLTGKVLSKCENKQFSPRETRHSSRISEKSNPHNLKGDLDQPLSVSVDELEREKPYSPKITIKPIKESEPSEDKEGHKGSLKITITKQSDNTHSILKMCSPDFEHRQKYSENEEQNVVPKLVIKTSDTHSDQHSPKTRSAKQVPSNSSMRSGSPRITIKPIVKPDTVSSPLKITIKPIGKPEEFSRQQQRHSPKQSKIKSDDDHYTTRSKIMKLSDSTDVHSPKVTIKPVKPPEESEIISTPKITIKPIEKPDEARVSPKITIKPVVRPVEAEVEVEDEVKERIVLKINKGNLPSKDTERINRESRKREHEDDKSEKLAKIKLKFSKDGDAHIVHKNDTDIQVSNKRQHDFEIEKFKRFKADMADSDEDVKLIENRQSPIVISEDSQSQDSVILIEDAKDPLADVTIPEPQPQVVPIITPRKRGRPRKVPLVARQDFAIEPKERIVQATTVPVSVANTESPETTGRPKRSCRAQSVRDTLGIKPRKPSKPRGGKRGAGPKSISFKPEKGTSNCLAIAYQEIDNRLLGLVPGFSEQKINIIKKSLLAEEAIQDAQNASVLKISCENSPEKVDSEKEQPIKPLGLKGLLEAAKDQNIIEVIEIDTPSNSPKCLEPPSIDKIEEENVADEKIGSTRKDISASDIIVEIKNFEIQKEGLGLREDADCIKESSDYCGTDAAVSDVEMQPPTPVFAPPLIETSAVDINSTTDIAMFEEETRMSADVSSRAQTPAKQVVSSDMVVEESQSSIQSTATTESGKISRKSRLEVHQDQDGSIFTADQLNEYYWGGNGPFMIQEQVAHFLGIKSFKRKYPGIPRRMVDMQERDHIRENGLASESMCDLGLTAVNSADILDIMYTDFQDKYEEYCRFQRDKQAKDLLNKQKALSLQANQEKSKLDILEQAVQSAAAYNANFNKTRREQRRACMDLQTMNIHYPKGKLKKINMPKIGHYPVAVVPGQFTDYYREFTPTELNNLPLNTMLYNELHKILPEVSDSDSESSGSDSEESSSSGSESNSSCEDNCKMCEKSSVISRKSPVNSGI